ncbi:hypothetical protein KKH24_00310 [Patescibacteria group bacterium]|nr:hypothetical protein [Patescibacteria group bacterium]
MNFKEAKERLLPFVLPLVFFLLPWQIRWIFSQQLIAGNAFEYGVISLYAVEVLVFIALLLYGRLKISADYQKVIGFALLFLLYVFVSSLFAINHAVAFGQLIHIVFAILLFLLLLDKRTNLRHTALGFVLGLVIPCCLGMWQVVTGGSGASTILGLAHRDAQTLGDAVLTLSDGVRILRAYGSFSHPNIFGGYLAVGLLSFLLFPTSLSREHGPISWSYFLRPLFILILIISLIITYSQSAWLAVVVAFICGLSMWLFVSNSSSNDSKRKIHLSRFFGQWSGSERTLKWLAGFFVVIVMLGSILGVQALSLAGIGQTSIAQRAEQYQQWPQVAVGSWVLGSGLGNYTYALEGVYSGRWWWEYQPVHNVLLLVIGEIGIAGLVILISWFFAIDKFNFSRFPKRSAVVAMSIGCALLIIAGLDHYLWTQWSGLVLTVYVMAMTVRIE